MKKRCKICLNNGLIHIYNNVIKVHYGRETLTVEYMSKDLEETTTTYFYEDVIKYELTVWLSH